MKVSKNSLRILGALTVLLAAVECDKLNVEIRVFEQTDSKLVSVVYHSDFDGVVEDKKGNHKVYHAYAFKLDSAIDSGKLKTNFDENFENKIEVISKASIITDEGALLAISEKDPVLESSDPTSKIAYFEKVSVEKIDNQSSGFDGLQNQKSWLLGLRVKIECKGDDRIIYTYPQVEFTGEPSLNMKITVHFIAVKKENPLLLLSWSFGLMDKKEYIPFSGKEYKPAYEFLVSSNKSQEKQKPIIVNQANPNGNSSLRLTLSNQQQSICDGSSVSSSFKLNNQKLIEKPIVPFFPKIYVLEAIPSTSETSMPSLYYEINGLSNSPSSFGQQNSSVENENQAIIVAKLPNDKMSFSHQTADFTSCLENANNEKGVPHVGIQFIFSETRRRILV